MEIRKAIPADIPAVMNIYHIAQDYMIASGNPNQWGKTHPAESLIRQDVADGICHLVCDGGRIHGVFALFGGEDPTYKIIDGAWQSDGEYVTIHRIAGDGSGGVFRAATDYAKSLCGSVRLDTHEDNRTMQHLAGKYGFVRCGIIYLANGDPRIAYQWTRD